MSTQLFQQLPWVGGLNTSLDESMIPPNQLTVCSNVQFDTRGSRKKRDGINHNFDSNTTGTNSIIGLHDYWYGTSTRLNKLVSVTSDGKVYSYTSGTATQLTVGGTAWSGTLTTCSMITFGNILIIAVDGSSNVMKYWNGDNSTPLQDIFNDYKNNTLTRASSGTTRTIVFKEAFKGTNGSTVIVAFSGDATHYNGTFTVTGVSTTTVANDTITYTATSSLTESATADTTLVVGSNQVPKATILREFYGRILTNDKSNVDLLHYSPTSDYTQWYGYGDSGAIPIGSGDGDSVGINGIFPVFKGSLFVAKLTKLYRLDGTTPEDITVQKISDGIGCVSHNSIVPVDQDDIFFVSQKGVHSLSATQQFGDFGSTYVSIDIQKTFNDSFSKSRLAYVWGAYLPNLNSIAFTFSSSGSTSNDSFYLYNIPIKAWYNWPGLSCQSLIAADNSDKKRFYIGTNKGRISKTLNGSNYDISNSGVNSAIAYRLTTGIIYPDGNPYTYKGFKRFILLFKPQNTYTISVSVTIDNLAVNSENSLNFNDITGSDLVGTTFITGTSVVGYEVPLAPYVKTIDGYGRGCKIDIAQNGTDETAEIQGFMIEWESAGVSYVAYTA
jgi:hypothetical protein